MKVTLPTEIDISGKNYPPMIIPEFVGLMDRFIDTANRLQHEVPKLLGTYTHLGIVGIGGSQVQPLLLRPHATVDVTHLEAPDPYILGNLLKKDISSTRILYISRSGTTKEVLSFAPYLQKYQSIAVTNGGSLQQIAEKLKFAVIKVSIDVSGRFAIQNELGIVPMVAMGINAVEFLSALQDSYMKHFKANSIADKTAKALFNIEKSGIAKMKILTSGAYMTGVGVLFTQLINESAPKKETDAIDSSLHVMPRSAHSDVQRWYGGVKDSFIFSFSCAKYTKDVQAPLIPPDIAQFVPGASMSAGKHLNITSSAIEDTFPGSVFRVVLDDDSLTELAQCIGFLHAVTVRLCQLKGSDPFNQPAVQSYKDKADKIYKSL